MYIVKKPTALFYKNIIHKNPFRDFLLVLIMSMEIPFSNTCNFCHYTTNSKKDFNKHLTTRKHKILMDTNKISQEEASKNKCAFRCSCGKSYKHMSSLCYHRKRCETEKDKTKIEEIDPPIIVATNCQENGSNHIVNTLIPYV